MKKLTLIAMLALLTGWVLNAQPIDPKNLTTKGSYGEKKLRKAPKKVYIASFKAFFQVSAAATAKSSGGRNFGGGSYDGATRTEMAVAIDGVDNNDFIAIVDEVYQRFVQGLKDQGYEIITADEAAKAPFYEGWERKEGGRVNSAQMKGYVMAVPTGYDYFIRKETGSGREKGTFIDKTPELSGDLNDAVIAEVAFIFPTIDLDTKGGVYAKGSSVSAKINMRLSPVGIDGSTISQAAFTKIKFVAGDGPGAAADAYLTTTIKKEVYFPDVFAEKKFKERTAAQTTPAYYSVVFTQDSDTKVTHTAHCDEDKYKKATADAMNQMVDYSLEQLKENAN